MKTSRFEIQIIASVFVLAGVVACAPASQNTGENPPSGSSMMDHSAMSHDMAGMSKPGALKPYKPYPYPFATSLVSGEKLGPDAVSFVEGEYEVRVNNAAEQAAFKADSAKFLAKIQAAYKDAKPNPLTTCPVCGMKVDGGFVPFVYEGRQFAVCNASEITDFQKDADKYVKMWDEAAQAAAKP